MIKDRLREWMPLQRLVSVRRLRYIVVPALLWFVVGVVFFGSRHGPLAGWPMLTRQRLFGSHAHRMPPATTLPELEPPVSCYGPRQRLLSDSPDDELQYGDLGLVCTRHTLERVV